MKYVLIFFTILYTSKGYNQASLKKDSTLFFLQQSKNNSFTIPQKREFLKKSLLFAEKYTKDSAKCEYLCKIAYRFYQLKDSTAFKKINKKAHQLALKLKDSFYIADSHWSYADFYSDLRLYNESFFHYSEAYHIYEQLDKTWESGRMLYAMAFIKGRFRDYKSSEVLTIEAIKRFKKVKDNYYIYQAYNHLGQLWVDVKEYDKALFYYNKSLSFFKKINNNKTKYLGTYNNMANVYLKKKQFKKALGYYNKDLIREKAINDIARILTNKAYCKLLMKDTLGIKKDFLRSLQIRDSLKNREDILASKIHISDYYKYVKDTLKALSYAKEANYLAKQLKNGGYYLRTLQQLANLDTKNAKKYLDNYIVFNDSLIHEERITQNKFTRIEFETDEYIEETEKLSQQNLLISISSIATILVLSLLFFIRVQKAKNEKLLLEADEQKANEEVYILTLQQQAKLEEERVNERNRISAELHDGVLGKLFGTRVNLGFLGMQMKTDTQEKHQAYLEELQVIEKEIREVSHKLSDNFDDATIGFSSIIEQLLKDKSQLGNFKYQFHQNKNINWKTVNEVTKANVYRIIQEALQNIIKHAKAKNVILDFSKEESILEIVLKDDGVGFDMTKSKKGIGLKNIKSRVQKIEGTLHLTSSKNKGTSLTIHIPIKTNE